jgi:hypothetical protein
VTSNATSRPATSIVRGTILSATASAQTGIVRVDQVRHAISPARLSRVTSTAKIRLAMVSAATAIALVSAVPNAVSRAGAGRVT